MTKYEIQNSFGDYITTLFAKNKKEAEHIAKQRYKTNDIIAIEKETSIYEREFSIW